jgi:hypothetical protein
MGDRFSPRDARHRNIEMMLRRIDLRLDPRPLPGIGHNGGPPLDMSYEAWLWRRVVTKAWATPPREIALRRLARAERLGLTYREFTAVILDTGHHLSAAFLPLHHAMQWRQLPDGRIALIEDPDLAVRRRAFDGRLFLLLDEARLPSADAALPAKLARAALKHFGPRAEGLLRLKETGNPAAGSKAMSRFCARHRLHPREAFLLGAEGRELAASQALGLGLFKALIEWQPGPG